MGQCTIRKALQLVNGIDLKTVTRIPFDTCQIGNSTRKEKPSATRDSARSLSPLEIVHSDVIGLIDVERFGGARYFVTLYDVSSATSLGRFLKKQAEVLHAIQNMVSELETSRGGRVQRFRVDNVGEYISKQFNMCLTQKGISSEPSAPYSPQSDGKTERQNSTLNDMARAMLLDIHHINGYQKLWAEAVNTANYLRNRMFTVACNESEKTPFEVIRVRNRIWHTFGDLFAEPICIFPKARGNPNFGARAQVGVLVGLVRGDSYKIYFPGSKKVSLSRDVTFQETETCAKEKDNQRIPRGIYGDETEKPYVILHEELSEEEN